jgi:hypothetical protein
VSNFDKKLVSARLFSRLHQKSVPVPIKITFFTFAFITKLLQHSFKMDVKKSKIDKIVCHVSFIRHFVALTPSWHSSQARRALNPCVLQNTSYKTHIIIYYFLLIT